MARQLIVQAHFLHLTTHATGSPRSGPVMPLIISEQKEKVIPLKNRRFSALVAGHPSDAMA